MSIQWKVALSSLLAVALGLGLAGWLAVQSIEQLELVRLQESLQTSTGLASFFLQPILTRREPPATDSLQSVAHELSRQALARVTIIDRTGVVLADSDTTDAAVPSLENHATRPEIAGALTGQPSTDVRKSRTTGTRMSYFAMPVRSTDGTVAAVIRLALPLVELDARIRTLEQRLVLAFGMAFAVSMTLSIMLARRLTSPFTEMATVARQLAAGALGRRISTTTADEAGVLGATFNQMADRLEATIREVSEDRAQLLAVLTSMAEGVMVLDCTGRVLQVNPALERMLLLRPGESRGRVHHEIIRNQAFNDLAVMVLESREPREQEIVAGAHILRVQATVAGCQRPNEPCAILVFHDVTALRRLENVRKDFVANVSHELRTPLTSIKGYVEALLDGGIEDRDAAARFLRIVLTQADRLNLILEDLLQLSQIESGQVRLKREPVHLAPVVERTVALIKPMADKKGHELTVDVPASLPAVLGDEERLVQVLTNLLDNAIKYTPEHGRIHVAARLAQLRPDSSHHGTAPGVEVTVSDTGIGIPEQDRPRVFERFYRVDKARSRELGGTGLGLAIVKHIVEGHEGRVWVEGNAPRGSRFVIQLRGADRPA